MRQVQKARGRKKPKKKAEPLAEGIIPLRTNGQREWASMSDDKIIAYARKIIEERDVKGRKGLQKADQGLYDILRKRGLQDRIGLGKQRRDWSSMTDEDIVGYTRKVIKDKRLKGKTHLQKADSGLYKVLRKRGLLDKISGYMAPVERAGRRIWRSMSDDELVEYARKVISENGLGGGESWQMRMADCITFC